MNCTKYLVHANFRSCDGNGRLFVLCYGCGYCTHDYEVSQRTLAAPGVKCRLSVQEDASYFYTWQLAVRG